MKRAKRKIKEVGLQTVKNKRVLVRVELIKKEIKKCLIIVIAAFIMAFNLKNLVQPGDLLPGGFQGLTLLIQKIGNESFGVYIPFTVIYLILNAVPIFISFRFIGKKFTAYSCLMILLVSLFTDFLPEFIITEDILLICIYSGIIHGLAVSLCLLANATSGGTDFIAIFVSEKYGFDAWNFIFAGNLVILGVAGFLFSWDIALYSIIFQFAATQILQMLYKRYQKHTLFIVTDFPDEVYKKIKLVTRHDATLFRGIGCYMQEERDMLYSVVSSDEIRKLIPEVKKVDEKAFINIVKTENIWGNFYQKRND